MSCQSYNETMHYITRAEIRGVELNLGFEKTDDCVLLFRKKIKSEEVQLGIMDVWTKNAGVFH